jgi:hypothetical protein
MLGVRKSVAEDIVLHQLAQLPLQFYWLRALCRFYNSFPAADSPQLMDIVARLAAAGMHDWTAQFNTANGALVGLC